MKDSKCDMRQIRNPLKKKIIVNITTEIILL